MPNKPLNPALSPWVNFLRELRRKYPELDNMSRKEFYPLASPLYRLWVDYHKTSKTKSIVKSIEEYVKKFL